MRKHYFDNGKALASFLGIVYHSALVFAGANWLISAPDSLPLLQIYTKYINLFRMPLFLFISGYFAAYSVKKYNLRDFTINRLSRLGIPLISTMITFNIIEKLYVYQFQDKDLSSILTVMIPWSTRFQMLSHLWFLYYVLVFSLLLYIGVLLIKKYSSVSLVKKFASFKIGRLGNCADAVFLAGSMGLFGVCGVLHVISGFHHELFSLLTFGANLPFFLLGVLTFANWEYLESKFLKLSGARFIVVGLLLIVSYFIAEKISGVIPNSNTLFNMLPRYFSLILVLGLLYRFLNRSNRVLKYMSESSYSVYLLHHPVIVVVSYYCIKHFELPNPMTGYVVVLVLSTIVVYALDFLLIRSTKIGKLLFTGTFGARRKQMVNVDPGASLNPERLA